MCFTRLHVVFSYALQDFNVLCFYALLDFNVFYFYALEDFNVLYCYALQDFMSSIFYALQLFFSVQVFSYPYPIAWVEKKKIRKQIKEKRQNDRYDN